MTEPSASTSTSEQCKYMAAAYPTLTAEESCGNHRHIPEVFALASAMAAVFQSEVTDEKVGWFLEDADAVVDDFDQAPGNWTVTEPEISARHGVTQEFKVNDQVYVLPDGDWEASVPVRLSTWLTWHEDDA